VTVQHFVKRLKHLAPQCVPKDVLELTLKTTAEFLQQLPEGLVLRVTRMGKLNVQGVKAVHDELLRGRA
jgi:hypothetical protein